MAIEDLLSQRNSQVSMSIILSGNLSDKVSELAKALGHMTRVKDELEDQNKTLLQQNSELCEKLLNPTHPASTTQQQDLPAGIANTLSSSGTSQQQYRPANIKNSLPSPKSWDMYRSELDELNAIRARARKES